jgi:hypothetical protein
VLVSEKNHMSQRRLMAPMFHRQRIAKFGAKQ